MVSKVEDYHSFVPWCKQSRVIRRVGSTYVEAELVVGFQMLTERYVGAPGLLGTSPGHLTWAPGKVSIHRARQPATA